jgi:hypothetical protein
MATTTTNYGFDVPTSSDLVKNGATQIALLGQDLDTFLFRPFTRNGILNGSFNVWQRGTSISNFGAFTLYTADRWNFISTNSGRTISRQLTNDSTNLPDIQYCGRFQRDSGNTDTTYWQASQSLETVNSIPYAGKTVTLSFYARKGANYSPTSSLLTVSLKTGTGTDQQVGSYTGSADVVNTTATLTTTWQRFTYSGTAATTAKELGVIFRADPTGTAGAADYFEITGVQVEIGNQASPYAPATPTYATELAACQRYYWRNTNTGSGGQNITLGLTVSTQICYFGVQFPVTMRTTPSALDYSAVGISSASVGYSGGTAALTSGQVSPSASTISYTHTSAVLTNDRSYLVQLGASTGYIGFSAEL